MSLPGPRKNMRALQGQPNSRATQKHACPPGPTKRALQGQTGRTQQLGSLSECSLLIFPPYQGRPPVNSTNRPPAYVGGKTSREGIPVLCEGHKGEDAVRQDGKGGGGGALSKAG